MRSLRLPHLLSALVAVAALAGGSGAALAAAPAKHHNAKDLVGAKIRTEGHHDIEKKGKFTTSVEVKKGKIAAVHVKHAERGDIPVKKYKTYRKLAQSAPARIVYAALELAQSQDLGTEYIGYSYIDDEGNEQIYWFPVEMVLDGDTGAIDYAPLGS
jgi:hypothetical protein